MSAESETVPRIQLERWVLGRLGREQRLALEARAQAEPELRERLEKVRAEIDAAAMDLPPLQLPPQADDSPLFTWLKSFQLPAVGLAGALAAAVVLFLLLPRDGNDLVYRGGFELQVYQLRLGVATEQGSLVRAQPGDVLQLEIASTEAAWVAAYGVQDDGFVSVWLEPHAVDAHELTKGAVELDDYAGVERMFVLVSEEPVDLEAVELVVGDLYDRPLVDLDALPGLGRGVRQRSVLVLKEETP